MKKTALMLKTGEHPDLRGRSPVEDDLDDIEQILRLKVMKAILAFDPSRVRSGGRNGRSARDGYVNMCLRDQVKDIVKRKRRGEMLIDDIAPVSLDSGHDAGGPRDRFDQRYLSTDHDQVFAEVEDELPHLPNTLTERERAVLALMYQDFRQTEIAVRLSITKREVESSVRAIRTKLADWRPGRSEPKAAVPA